MIKPAVSQGPERTQGSPDAEPTAQSLVDQCIEAALAQRTSDIHIEAQNDKVVFRMRIDGLLRIWKEVPIELHSQIIARLKVIARLDISDKRRPQDGRFSLQTKSGIRDFRISTVPMLEGEKAVIRVMHQDVSQLTIKSVGYSEPNLKVYNEMLGKPHGLLLHCGPTGSGKTTALYAAVNHLSKTWRNIQTIEDPVEGRLPGVNQAQVNPEQGLTFASILRAYLRQDCDVILVGEIRDGETGNLAVQASLTGHLVLGTLHTNSAVGAISRLSEMGIPAFYLASCLVGAVSQRLVRKLCKHCRRAFQPSLEIQEQCGIAPNQPLYQAVGCVQCGKVGFQGRVGIQEIFPITPAIREAIQNNAPATELQNIASRGGMINIYMDGIAKATAGLTTLEEVYRSVTAD